MSQSDLVETTLECDAEDPSSASTFDWSTPTQTVAFIPVIPATVKRVLGKPGGRRAVCLGLIGLCQRSGYTPEQVFRLCEEYPEEPALGRYREHPAGFDALLRAD